RAVVILREICPSLIDLGKDKIGSRKARPETLAQGFERFPVPRHQPRIQQARSGALIERGSVVQQAIRVPNLQSEGAFNSVMKASKQIFDGRVKLRRSFV